MTALAGFWHFGGKPKAGAQCARMLSAQAIYGPHDSWVWEAENVALGRRLFRILPEDEFDRPPLERKERFVLAADLRLDNRDDLIGALRIEGERARTMADSGILLLAWERWGEECFGHLVGEYAFALWDGGRRRLVLARDPMGMRPLHYHRGRDFFASASMPKGLHALPEIPRAPDEERTAEFLLLMSESGSKSFFKDVERVEQGHFALVTADGVAQHRHWQPGRRTVRLKNADEYAEGLLHRLDEATRSCLRGAGSAIGAHLSSGFDSSAVATSAALQTARTNGKVFAFTAVPREGYDGPVPRGGIGDEGPIAAKTAALHPNMEHVLIRTEGRSPLDGLDRSFVLYDRPMFNICNMVWADAINDAAQVRGLSVLLNGFMGNMTISYDGNTHLTGLMRNGRWLAWLRESRKLARSGRLRWTGIVAQSFGPYVPRFAWRWAVAAARKSALDPRIFAGIRADRIMQMGLRGGAQELDYRPRRDGFETRLWAMRRVDPGNYNKGVLGGWGNEQRDPTADRRLVEFCLGIPEEQFLANGRTKALARRALANRVTPDVIDLLGKGIQAADWHEGLSRARGALREEVARLADCAPAAAIIDISRMASLVENWPAGRWGQESIVASYRLALLRAMSAGHFLRRASGDNA